MKRVAVLFGILLVANAGCGLLIAGGIAGGVAIKKRSARKDTIAQMKTANDQGDAALRSGNAQLALTHYGKAQQSLYGYCNKWERTTKFPALVSEYPEIARTARGLVAAHQAQQNDSAMAAVAFAMLPKKEAEPLLKQAKMAEVSAEAVATAPHMYEGLRAKWHGEVTFARHDPSTDIMQLVVVPYSWQRRQVGFTNQRYYDHQLKIYRDRLVPRYRNFKVQLQHRAFNVELKGYNEIITPGTAGTFLGKVAGGGRGVVLQDAVATELSKVPGGRAVWLLGVAVPSAV